jgi:aspartate/methionine/tyrosine aminotransferase
MHDSNSVGSFRNIPYMGVIWVVAEAQKLGFWNGHPDWCNLGQGQPEVAEMEGAPPRIRSIEIDPSDQAYGPVGGTDELREQIANHMNRLYRQDHTSKYTAENVSVAMGGRLMLSRIFAALAPVRLGYQVPDYTAYQDMIQHQGTRLSPILIPTREENAFGLKGDQFESAVHQQNLDAYIFSNPCNPTGHVVQGEDLAQMVRVARDQSCTLISDEFYSHFIYNDSHPGSGPISAALHVEDVDQDPVLLVDGLTKSFRYPGWRIGWTVGPRSMIETLNRAASALDGGPSRPMQRAAIEALEPTRADQETEALRTVFSRKRNLMLDRLESFGIRCSPRPTGTFYIWADLSHLPAPFNDSFQFFHAALKDKVMTVPGTFFDIDPANTRPDSSSFRSWMRFSYGPDEPTVKKGLDRIEALLGKVLCSKH